MNRAVLEAAFAGLRTTWRRTHLDDLTDAAETDPEAGILGARELVILHPAHLARTKASS